MTRLVEAGIVAADWNAGEHKGMVTDSVVVFIVREGNPKGSRAGTTWPSPASRCVTPNPFTSGGARWNVMAGYGAQLEQGKCAEQARQYLRALFKNVVAQAKSARESLTTFSAGQGRRPARLRERGDLRAAAGPADRLRRPGPDDPDREPRRGDDGRLRGGQGLRRVPWSDEAQKVFAEEGYRPVSSRPRRARLPEACLALHDRRRRRLGERAGGVLRSRERLHGRGAAASSASRPKSYKDRELGAGCGGSGHDTNVRPVSR